jgi:hypothetical protein
MPTRQEILRTFEINNATLFGGRLQVPEIMVRRMGDLGRWYEPQQRYPRGLLVLSSSGHHIGGWRATLLHEQIHIAVPLEENDYHGALFLAEANRVGVLIGAELCEIEDGWMWPSHHLHLEEIEGNILDEDGGAEQRVRHSRGRRRLRGR